MKNFEKQKNRYPLAGLFYVFVIYIVWGSGYLFARLAVRGGFGPFFLGSTRIIIASLILLFVSKLFKKTLKPKVSDLRILIVCGLLMWVGGNGSVCVALKYIDSGLAALIVGLTPMWVAIMEAIIDRKAPSLLLIGSLVLGFSGLVILSLPLLTSGVEAEITGVILVIFAGMSWGAGSIIQNRRKVSLAPSVSSAFQMISGGFGLLIMALLVGEELPEPSPTAWFAWAYLIVFGSLVAFTSYVAALRLLPASIVLTYAYVNPVIALVLGWLVVDERITGSVIFGMVLVIAGVIGVFRDKGTQQREL